MNKTHGFCGTLSEVVEFSGYDDFGAHTIFMAKLIGTWVIISESDATLSINKLIIYVQPLAPSAPMFIPSRTQINANIDLKLFLYKVEQSAYQAIQRRKQEPSKFEFISRTDPRYRQVNTVGWGRR